MSLGFSTASGYYSTAIGNHNTSSGYFSTAAGHNTTTSVYDCFVIGTFNKGTSSTGEPTSSNSWQPNDPLFEIGNGGNGQTGQWAYGWPTYVAGEGWTVAGDPSKNYTSDALVVYKNGDVTAGGVMKCQPSSDIPMYEP
jgi:hypothetical protein